MPRPRLLVVNPFRWVGGDIVAQQFLLRYSDPAALDMVVATIPRGDAYDQVRTFERPITVVTMEFGNREGSAAGRLRRLIDLALALPRLVTIAVTRRVDAIYTGDRGLAPYFSGALALLTGRALFLNAQHHHYPQSSRYIRWLARRAAGITVNSDFLRRVYLDVTGRPEAVARIHNAIQIERYDLALSGAEVRREFGIADEDDLVLLAGRITPFKGQQYLIMAAEQIVKERPRAHFLIVGTPDSDAPYTHEGVEYTSYLDYLKALIAERGLGERVILAGYRNDLPRVMAAATVVAMPSIEEPFGIVALEGMAMAKPIVATRAGGVPEFVEDGVTGRLVPQADVPALAAALLELLHDPERARAMGSRGRERALANHSGQAYAAAVTRFIRARLGYAGSG